MNLLTETIEAINASGHKPSDIVFIGSEESGHSCSWARFKVLANREYHEGYGSQKVAKDLIIVFSDGVQMTRAEYDGSEWWNYQTPFKKPAQTQPIGSLFVTENQVGWKSLESIHESLKSLESN
jgi:hypothetical protein